MGQSLFPSCLLSLHKNAQSSASGSHGNNFAQIGGQEASIVPCQCLGGSLYSNLRFCYWRTSWGIIHSIFSWISVYDEPQATRWWLSICSSVGVRNIPVGVMLQTDGTFLFKDTSCFFYTYSFTTFKILSTPTIWEVPRSIIKQWLQR